MRNRVLALSLALAAVPTIAYPCTNIIVTRGASADGSTMITYAADSHEFYGELALIPPGVHRPGTMRDIIEWDTGKLLGRIKEAPVTYRVVGNINEYQVSVGETTFTGRKELEGPSGIVDYGSLMFIALQRAKTAREAIRVIAQVVDEYGYASTGESFSIADPNEAWIFEIIGKGEKAKGAVWVARRVPDGQISGHANQARIRTFPLNDPDNVMYARDVITFAREKGWFAGKDAEFSFADTYAPLDFGALRFCESRVWSVFRRAAPSLDLGPEYVDGSRRDLRLPLWVKPDRKLSVRDVMQLMRDHFEGTPFDMTKDVGAGPFACPYRWRPMTWEVDGGKYVHERAISTQQTGFSFVAQSRRDLPDPIGGVLWFGVDDTYSTVYVPFYSSTSEAPRAWAAGTCSFDRFCWDSAFWVFNFVTNWTYTRYSDMIVDVQKVQEELEAAFIANQPAVEKAALELHRQSPQLARDYLTAYSKEQGENVVARWRKLGEFLLWKYLDGNVRDAQGHVTHPKYPDSWYRAIVRDAGDRVRQHPDPTPTPAP
ncbi:MAG: dipeptidase [Acidobacteriota bacterium]